ncbi:hypothetical protein COCCU_13500 [Corynebacterium occultum]|uniref:Tc1-like transposase DDE domain-containing protein n=1 Tax=Corynebacterium occultum TaxID=2675219 RepID=A0A6B8VWT0_9CORY|nr:hypothetical protein COCCU_13500 [Corynebacterium occultum]
MAPSRAVKTWKTSTDPDFETKKNRVLELYAIADGKTVPGREDPEVSSTTSDLHPPAGVCHLLTAFDLSTGLLYGHIKPAKTRTQFLAFRRYLRSLHPSQVWIGIVLDNFSPHRSTQVDSRVGDWAEANNVESAYTPLSGSWLNRIKAQFTGLRYFVLGGTDFASYRESARMIRRYIAWRNTHTTGLILRKVITRAGIIKRAKVA